MKPLALDLCAGRGGWSLGLQAAGWNVVGFDIENHGYRGGQLVLQDVRTLDGRKCRGKVGLIVASPPCPEYSVWGMRMFHPHPKQPDKSIWEACLRLRDEVGCPMVLENVKAASLFWGKPAWKFGSYHLWGDLPALMPYGKPRKGMDLKVGWQMRDVRRYSSKSPERKAWSAKVAEIPFDLAYWIGQVYLPPSATNAIADVCSRSSEVEGVSAPRKVLGVSDRS